MQHNVAIRQAFAQGAKLDIHDLANLLAIERMEYHDIVDTVDELGPEVFTDHFQDRLFHARIILLARHLLNALRTEVRRHDDHGVAKIDRTTVTVGQPAVIEHLQQHVEYIRVRLLDLVEQDHRIGSTPHGFGQVTALFVTDVTGRRADQPRD